MGRTEKMRQVDTASTTTRYNLVCSTNLSSTHTHTHTHDMMYVRAVQFFVAEPKEVVFTDYQVGNTYQVRDSSIYYIHVC